jgi:excisionase family DNA binding protein
MTAEGGVPVAVIGLADYAQVGQSAEVTQLVGDGDLLTTAEAASIIGCSVTYVIKLVDDGKIGGRLPGSKHRRVTRAEAERIRDEIRKANES